MGFVTIWTLTTEYKFTVNLQQQFANWRNIAERSHFNKPRMHPVWSILYYSRRISSVVKQCHRSSFKCTKGHKKFNKI